MDQSRWKESSLDKAGEVIGAKIVVQALGHAFGNLNELKWKSS